MKKVILDLAVTLDGFIEGPSGETDWCIMEDDMGLDTFMDSIDTIFYGRVSYDAWGNFQPDSYMTDAEQQLWTAIHSKDKYVFSRQERKGSNAAFISSDISSQVRAIQQKGGKDIWLYGGAGLIRTFIDLDLIDSYRLSVHPVVLGSGKPLFENLQHRIGLKLTGNRTFRSGVIQLIYEPERLSRS